MARKPLAVRAMTHGQLKLEYASKCQHHGCDAVKALGYSGRASFQDLQSALLKYERAAKRGDWQRAEDALISIASPTFGQAAGDSE